MLKDLFASQKTIEQLLENSSEKTNWSEKQAWFERQLQYLQHERLIHLLVTLTVGLASLISCFVSLFKPSLPIFLLDFILVTLFLAYIFHYQKLENTVQKWYGLLGELGVRI